MILESKSKALPLGYYSLFPNKFFSFDIFLNLD